MGCVGRLEDYLLTSDGAGLMAVAADAVKLTADELVSVIKLFDRTASTESTVSEFTTSPQFTLVFDETGPPSAVGRGD